MSSPVLSHETFSASRAAILPDISEDGPSAANRLEWLAGLTADQAASGCGADVTTAKDHLGEFAITVGFENARAVVAIRGEVDRVNAPELGAILDAVIERHRSVVLDLAELDFMNGWGLGMLAARASRHGRSGGTLAIRSPSAMVLRLLDITGVAEVVLLENPEPPPRHLGAEQSSEIAERISGPGRTSCLRTLGRSRPSPPIPTSSMAPCASWWH